MDHKGSNAPHAKIHLVCNGKRVITWIFRHKEYCLANDGKAFHRQFAVDACNNDSALSWIQGAINYQDIAFEYSSAFHRVARYPDEQYCFRIGNHQVIDIQFRFAVITSRREKATRNMPGNKRRRNLTHSSTHTENRDSCHIRLKACPKIQIL